MRNRRRPLWSTTKHSRLWIGWPKEYDKSVQSVDKLTKAANDNSAALNAASEQAQKLGVTTENITASEAELIAIFNRGVTAIDARKAAIADMVESDRLLAIQEQRQIELLKQGEQALQAEVLALRDAERSNQGMRLLRPRPQPTRKHGSVRRLP